MIDLSYVGYEVAGKCLLEDVSLWLRSGEVLAVMGPNGAGKSTLLKLIAGEMAPTRGEICINGRLLRDISLSERARIRAVLPQSSSLSFPFNVRQIVMMGRSPHRGEGLHRDLQVVTKALRLADVAHLESRVFTTLSGGERQRVHLARVLAQIWRKPGDERARYLLLDEPTSALDLAHQHQALGIAREFARESNVGVLAVLHDLNLASIYADRIAILNRGRLQCQGKPAEVLTPNNILQGFGVPALVIDHPQRSGCPLVVTPAAEAAAMPPGKAASAAGPAIR